MEKEGGAFTWAKNHNSKFEINKLSLIHFDRNKQTQGTPMHKLNLQLDAETISPKDNIKYLGVIFDEKLRWHQQRAEVICKGKTYVSAL